MVLDPFPVSKGRNGTMITGVVVHTGTVLGAFGCWVQRCRPKDTCIVVLDTREAGDTREPDRIPV